MIVHVYDSIQEDNYCHVTCEGINHFHRDYSMFQHAVHAWVHVWLSVHHSYAQEDVFYIMCYMYVIAAGPAS